MSETENRRNAYIFLSGNTVLQYIGGTKCLNTQCHPLAPNSSIDKHIHTEQHALTASPKDFVSSEIKETIQSVLVFYY